MRCKENWRAEFSCSRNKPGYATDQQWHWSCQPFAYRCGRRTHNMNRPNAGCVSDPASSYRTASGLLGPTAFKPGTIFNGLKSSALLRDGICFDRTRPWSHLCISITVLICRVAGHWRLLGCIVNTGFSDTTEIESFYCADKWALVSLIA